MKSNLTPPEALTQVVFIHDYLQLVFGKDVLNVFNPSSVQVSGRTYVRGKPGFADALVTLIGARVVEAKRIGTSGLIYMFSDGNSFEVSGEPADPKDLEAFELSGPNVPWLVAHNA